MIKGIVTDKLDYCLDAIFNVGIEEEHSIYSDKWINLANEEQKFNCPNTYWDSDGLYFFGNPTSNVIIEQYNPNIFTFEVIFSPSCLSHGDDQTIFANYEYGGYGLYIDSNNRLIFEIYIGSSYRSLIFPITLSSADIYKISCSFDGRYIKGYIDGKLLSTVDLGKEYKYGLPQNNTLLVLGGDPFGNIVSLSHLIGVIYSFRAYSRVLSDGEIYSNNLTDNKRYPIKTRGKNTYKWKELNEENPAYVTSQISWTMGQPNRDVWEKANNYPCFIFTGHVGQSDNWGAVTFLISDREEGIKIIPPSDNYYGWAYRSFQFIYEDMVWYVRACYCITNSYQISAPSNIMYLDLLHKMNTNSITTSNIDNFNSKGGYIAEVTQFMTQLKVLTSRVIKEKPEAGIITDGRVKYVRVRASDGSYSNALAFLVSPENVDFNDGRSLNEHLDDKALESIYSENGINLGRKTYQDTEEENIEPGHHSSAIGQMVKATGQYSFATGEETDASGDYSRTSGSHSAASGDYSAADGAYSEASGIGSHAEGAYTKATGDYSHAAGFQSESKGKYSTAIGMGTLAEGEGSFAIGVNTVAKGRASFAAGEGTIAASSNQFVHGKYNIEDTEDKYIEIIGNGTDDANRSNAFAIGKNGDVYIDGKVEAAKFDGPAIYDTKMQEIQDYVLDLEPKDDKLMVYKGSGEEIELDLSKGAWENIQEKIGSWHSKKPINISKSWGRIVNFGYINRTKWRSACVFYAQLVLFANPPADAPTFDIEFELRVDDVVIDETWRPKETLEKGYHVIHLMHPIRQIPPDKEVHMVTVWAKTTGGTISVDPGGAQAAFFGMGIDSGDVRWDGQVKCQDDFELQRYNITFEQDDKIHKGYTIQYKEKIKEFLRFRILDNSSFKFHQKVYNKDASGIKTGWHYNITFEEDDYVFNMDDMVIGVHGLFTDAIRPNQDGIKAPDLTALTFRVLGDYIQKYKVNKTYITTETEIDTSKKSTTNILLNQNYSKTSQPIPIDEGKAIKLDFNFNDFKQIDVVQVKEVV